LERQHLVFIAAAGTVFAALIIVGLYFNPLKSQGTGNTGSNDNIIKARIGQPVNVKYSSTTVKRIQDLPTNNKLRVQVSSELQSTNLAGLGGEIRYSGMSITFVQKGKQETVTENQFKTIEYRFLPDPGNTTKYVYQDIRFVASSPTPQLVVTVVPLTSAKVGERYTVDLIGNTGGVLSYGYGQKTIEIIK
jgi:hypothetical protein